MGFDAVVLTCYAIGTLGGLLGLFPRGHFLRKPAAWAIGAGFAAHTLLIFLTIGSRGFALLSRGDLVQVMAWSLVFVYCVTWWRLRFPILGLTAGPLALALFSLSSLLGNVDGGLPEHMTGAFFILHLVVLSLNFALIALGLGSALYYLNLRRKLKSRKVLPEAGVDTPSLVAVDRVNKLIVLWGFPLFTLGLATGFAWAVLSRGAVVSSDPKEIASILLWLLYALIFMQRFVLGWQGKKAAVMLLVLFAATLCSLVGVNFFMHSHHNFFQTPMF
ncbi:MAG: cytochrome c biogenesis protein [Deltaproteobacteria bacterium]|nr:cytochrome c biogenesis protein [Deltaproteobacteria bacterium]